jgi:4-amino-4-deoxy-L-arabinose transferase-like glycosyltransferase
MIHGRACWRREAAARSARFQADCALLASRPVLISRVLEGKPEAGTARQPSFRTLWTPLAILALSVALRVGWAATGPKVIESEGSYYARVGENLVAGRGYLGLRENGTQLLYPPLYPLAIAAGVELGMRSEAAARLVSLLAGIALPLIVFAVASRLYGRRAGACAGTLAAAHPLLVVLSSSVLSESLYLTLSLAGLAFSIRLVSSGTRASALGAGAAFGLAYLTRPEAMLLVVLVGAGVLLACRDRWRPALRRVVLLGAVFAVFALPYVAFLHRETGQLRFEAKTADGIAYSLRRAAGEPLGKIYFGVDRDLKETGLGNTSNLELIRSTHASLAARARMTVANGKMNLARLLGGLGGLAFGGPFFGALVALGLFGTAWSRRRLDEELPLVAAVGLTLVTFTAWSYFHDRFLFPLLLPAVVWAGYGLDLAGGWMRVSLLNWRASPRLATGLGLAAPALALVLSCGTSAIGVRDVDELSDAWSALRFERPLAEELGHGAAPGHSRIADSRATIAFYAGAVLVPLAWSDEVTALRYFDAKQVDYLVIRDSDRHHFPYMAAWLDAGVPGGRCRPIDAVAIPDEGAVRLCRWSPVSPAFPTAAAAGRSASTTR